MSYFSSFGGLNFWHGDWTQDWILPTFSIYLWHKKYVLLLEMKNQSYLIKLHICQVCSVHSLSFGHLDWLSSHQSNWRVFLCIPSLSWTRSALSSFRFSCRMVHLRWMSSLLHFPWTVAVREQASPRQWGPRDIDIIGAIGDSAVLCKVRQCVIVWSLLFYQDEV